MSYKDWPNEILLNFLVNGAKPINREILTINDGDISLENIKQELLKRLKNKKNKEDRN